VTAARLLVNGLTLCNAACGLAAMVVLAVGPRAGLAEQDCLRWAALLITFAYLPDVLDGLAARALGVSSTVGAQLDVNADTTTFNLATALMVAVAPLYATGAAPLERLDLLFGGALAALAYASAGLVRSARLVVSEPPKAPVGRYFLGATTNIAALSTAALVLVGLAYDAPGLLAWAVPAQAILLAPLMVSRIAFPDVLQHLVKGVAPRWPVPALVASAFVWGPLTSWALAVYGYGLLGPLARAARGAPLR